MRQTNREIAELINERLNKTGQVIQDRYRSPVIENEIYAINTVSYIWLNPARAKMVPIKRAHEYKYSSLYYKYRGLPDPISDPYSLLKELTGIDFTGPASVQKFAKDHLNALIGQELSHLCHEMLEHQHSIGSQEFIGSRRRIQNKIPSTAPP